MSTSFRVPVAPMYTGTDQSCDPHFQARGAFGILREELDMPRIDESRPFIPVRIAVLTVSDTRTPADDKSADRFQLMDVFQLEHGSDPQISPDGKQVASLTGHAGAVTAVVATGTVDDAAAALRSGESVYVDPAATDLITTAEADQLRRAMGSKRSTERMRRLRGRFYDGMRERHGMIVARLPAPGDRLAENQADDEQPVIIQCQGTVCAR